MLTKRIIACLDVDAGRVVKGTQFLDLRDAGDPAALAAAHSKAGADEVVLLDITATHEKRATLLETVRRTARELFVPFTVGGGVRTLDDASAIFDASLITCIAQRFGSQAVIVAIDAKRNGADSEADSEAGFQAFVCGGRVATGKDAIAWAKEAEDSGAGEILLTSMDRDGTGVGFDCDLTRSIAQAVRIPVIASGGAGGAEHFVQVFREGAADAALAASIFHFGLSSISELKRHLQVAGIPVRFTY